LTGIAALKPAHTREAHHLANPREPRPGPSTKAFQSGEVVTGLRALPLERITRSVTSVDDHRFATGFDGYVATQILAIRRLVDDRNADVIPIRGLVKDIRRNFALFTRENFVCFDGLPYDYDAVQRREMVQRIGTGPFWAQTPGPSAYGTPRMAHKQFDRLVGVRPEDRQRGEVPMPRVCAILKSDQIR
jgi:hypothetical protein